MQEGQRAYKNFASASAKERSLENLQEPELSRNDLPEKYIG